MNKIIIALITLVIGISCKTRTEEKTDTNSTEVVEQTNTDTSSTVAKSDNTFDINSIPISDKLSGDLPYFKLPDGYLFNDPQKYHGTGVIKDFDREYFYVNRKYYPQEGKAFKAVIRAEDDKQFNLLELQRSFDDLIEQLGGKKLNNGDKLEENQKEALAQSDPNAYQNGFLHSCNNYENVHTYIIKTPEDLVWIQYNLGSESAFITILKKSSFTNKMGIISAEEIKKDLDEKGKSILYIEFDSDKATLKPEGVEAVKQIEILLLENPDLKISINGYTDNTGSPEHNLKLSDERALTVKNEIVKKGIVGERLQSKGFGQENPFADNGTEQGKSKNRRVEIIKT